MTATVPAASLALLPLLTIPDEVGQEDLMSIPPSPNNRVVQVHTAVNGVPVLAIGASSAGRD